MFALTGMKFISSAFCTERPLQVKKLAGRNPLSVNCQKCGMEYLPGGEYDAPRGSGAIFQCSLPFCLDQASLYCGPDDVYREVQTARFLDRSSPAAPIAGFHHAVGLLV